MTMIRRKTTETKPR